MLIFRVLDWPPFALEADEQALRTETALLFKQFQVEGEEMAREAAQKEKLNYPIFMILDQ